MKKYENILGFWNMVHDLDDVICVSLILSHVFLIALSTLSLEYIFIEQKEDSCRCIVRIA